MRNVAIAVDGETLTITVDLSVVGVKSASRKSMVVASTEGNVQVPGTDLRLGVNLYRRVT